MKHYSKEFKEEALKLSDEIGVKTVSYTHLLPALYANGLNRGSCGK